LARQPPSNPLRHPLIPPTPEETAKWREEAAKFREAAIARLSREFEIAVLIWGEEEARLRWKEAAKKQRGRRRGSTRPDQDKNLLTFYDWLVAQPDRPVPIKSLPRWIGEWVDKEIPGKYGASADAITMRLRRLLMQRDAERRARSHRNPLDPDWRNK
jgi:hypothetical protein